MCTATSHFSSDSFIESKEIIINPDQGFYRPVILTLKPNSFVSQSNRPDQLYHLRCDISEFSGQVNSDQKDKILTETVLKGLDDYLSEIKKQNKNAIIRFCYSPGFGNQKDK